jgi:hypothetical protein
MGGDGFGREGRYEVDAALEAFGIWEALFLGQAE